MELQELRNEINRIDDEMLALLGRRLAVCRSIAEYKRANGLPAGCRPGNRKAAHGDGTGRRSRSASGGAFNGAGPRGAGAHDGRGAAATG